MMDLPRATFALLSLPIIAGGAADDAPLLTMSASGSGMAVTPIPAAFSFTMHMPNPIRSWPSMAAAAVISGLDEVGTVSRTFVLNSRMLLKLP